MTPVVNDKYKYILFYNPKSACSFIRRLFMQLHDDEFTSSQKDRSQDWHNLNKLCPFDINKDYSDYYKFTLVRHPYTRFVSSYLNRVVSKKENLTEIEQFLTNKYGSDYPITFSFNQFLDCFVNSPFEYLNNVHFDPQSRMLAVSRPHKVTSEYSRQGLVFNKLKNIFRSKEDQQLMIHLDKVCAMESLEEDVISAYQQIFSGSNEMLEKLIYLLKTSEMYNVSYTDEGTIEDACDLSAESILKMSKTPGYENFLTPIVQQQLHEKFELDFELFGYDTDFHKALEFEHNKNKQLEKLVPDDFDAQSYLDKNPDLAINGITTTADALLHWIHHGRTEDRQY